MAVGASSSPRLRVSFFSWKRLTKISITLLFTLNFLWLFTYFLRHPIPVNIHLHLHQRPNPDPNYPHRHHLRRPFDHGPSLSTSKPWPVLPSYLPWLPPSSDTRVGSCEGFFGNGFTRPVNIVARTSGSGWFRCHYSETLRSSVCEGGMVRMDPTEIRMSKGGEGIEEVIGRKDEDELPEFEPGAFRISAPVDETKRAVSPEFLDKYLPEGVILRHTMRELIGTMELVRESELNCSQWIEEPTLLLTRFEYANVFHTYTDWYSAYVSARVTGLPTRPHVVFVDGHSKVRDML
ncbi:hypothetical protein Cgig2_031099 [Carnegiea gigantea]|uniref:Uncharacterized protein n=1 Tax=Carnegiea gigantea TaxID=171969 RepID=A0A9Q1GWL8_9CARY|nr:hypothetical protein Cgig2_031099 [Carnegiea gigantea]